MLNKYVTATSLPAAFLLPGDKIVHPWRGTPEEVTSVTRWSETVSLSLHSGGGLVIDRHRRVSLWA